VLRLAVKAWAHTTVFELDDRNDFRKAFNALDEGIFDHLTKAPGERQKLRGRQVLIAEENYLCSRQTWRMSPITFSPGSDARSMPKISALIEPDRRLNSKPFVAITIAVPAAMSRVPQFNIGQC
jgi:hypothetical protein